MDLRTKKWIGSALRWAVCLFAVGWLAYTIEWEQLKRVWLEADRQLLLISLLVFAPAQILIAIRLRWLLAVQQVHLTTWQVVKVTFAGNFIINTLPVGTTGGDSVKAYYIARDTPHKHEAVTTVFFDRLIGVLGLVTLAGIAALINWRNPAFAGVGQIIGLVLLAILTGAAVYYSARMRRLLRLDQIVARLPFAAHLQRIDRAVLQYRGRPRTIVAALAMSILLQLICVVSFFFAGWALGMVGESPWRTFPVYAGYCPICLLTGVLPIGGMELSFVGLFVHAANLGTAETAVSLSLFGRFIQLFWALPGGLVVLQAGRPTEPDIPPEPLPDAEATEVMAPVTSKAPPE
jgi:hypothetical protein